MPNPRPHHYLVICLDSDPTARPTVVVLFQSLGDGGSQAESLNCSSVLWDAGTDLPAAKCCEFTCTQEQYVLIAAGEDSLPAGVKWVRADSDTGEIRTTNIAGVTPGELLDVDSVIVACGLQRPVVPPPA